MTKTSSDLASVALSIPQHVVLSTAEADDVAPPVVPAVEDQ